MNRTGKALIDATRPFAVEDLGLSWWYTLSTFALLAVSMWVAASIHSSPLRAIVALLEGLLIVRTFILYHDHLHGALLSRSLVARLLFYPFGLFVFAPPSVWRATHNYHHAHTAELAASHIGSFPVMTLEQWQTASRWARWRYRFLRHPLNLFFGVVTIFASGMCVAPLLHVPKRHLDAALALALHGAMAWFWLQRDATQYLMTIVLPLAVACGIGSYLFYAQHNFPGIRLQPRVTWDYTLAARDSSSFMELGPLGAWFTGNIGFHHVHHLNPSIPFYRLPEALVALPELAVTPKTSLRPHDIAACLRLKLWHPERGIMVPFAAAKVVRAKTLQPG